MKLEIAPYQSALDELARALATVSERQETQDSTAYFRRERALALTLSAGLDSAPSWCRVSCGIMRDHADHLFGVCEALADHVSTESGASFWKAKMRTLNDLAEQIQNHLDHPLEIAEESGPSVTQPLAL